MSISLRTSEMISAAEEVRVRMSREWLRTEGRRRAGCPRRRIGSLCGAWKGVRRIQGGSR